MCGIAGFWDVGHRFDTNTGAKVIDDMSRAIRHRGPDDVGRYHDTPNGVWFGHRRLSVVDVSPEGHQPMASASGRYVLVFNGEVYNHRRLRPALEASGARFRGHSDTEFMLAAIEHWGIDRALEQFIGMFAFALWDRETRTLTLVRDRLGIKPLYYGWTGSLFVFGSELKAITALPGFDNPVDRGALCLLLRHNYIPAPYSIHQGIYKLPPASMLTVDRHWAATPCSVEAQAERVQKYWSLEEATASASHESRHKRDEDAVEELDGLLRDAVALRMEADVPLGAFLSGGVDSSTVVALMQAQSSRPVQTYSIGFHERAHDEARHAKAVAQHLGTDHHELYVSAQDALEVIPKLSTMFDEPFSDSSQIPTYLVSRLARSEVTVALSGDGGDELFAGYRRYLWAGQVDRWIDLVPRTVRQRTACSLRARPGFYEGVLGGVNRCMPPRLRVKNPHTKVGLLARMLHAASDDERYRMLISHWFDPAALVLDAAEPRPPLADFAAWPPIQDRTERMMYGDLIGYLPDDILVKVDRASMAVSLEARVPLLDHRVVEYAWRTPLHRKVRDGQGKWLLRQVLYRYVPRQLVERPKQGFGVPIDVWLRGPLRDWAEALLDERRLREDGFFDPAPIRRMWADHVSGRAREHHRLWDILMFQAWLSTTPTEQLAHDMPQPFSFDAPATPALAGQARA